MRRCIINLSVIFGGFIFFTVCIISTKAQTPHEQDIFSNISRGNQIVQKDYLKASNGQIDDNFGNSVAIDGDTMIVGAWQEDGQGRDSGAAYIFVRTEAGWVQQAYLKASNPGASDFFGSAVALSGDTAIIGASGEDSGASGVNGNQADNSTFGSGAVYVFVRQGVTWTQQAYLKASNPGVSDSFGYAIALSGDTVLIGAEGEASKVSGVNGNQMDNSTPWAGAAYVFIRQGTTWAQQAYLKASNPEQADLFGHTVALSKDTAIIGARHESSNASGVNGNQSNNLAPSSGAAYVFMRQGITWTQQAYLKASNNQTDGWFGSSVAVFGDTAIVGSVREDSNATGVNGNQTNNLAPDAGAAYIFVRQGITWTQLAYLKASNTGVDDAFGFTVSLFGNKAIVGAFQEDSQSRGINGNQTNNLAQDAGAAYIFERNGTTWTQQAYLKAPNTQAYDNFGYAVALSRDFALVGAINESNANVNSDHNNAIYRTGGAYIFGGLSNLTYLPFVLK